MEIEDRYLKLLNLLIHNKRNDQNGIISELIIRPSLDGRYGISYSAYMSKVYANTSIFVEDFEKGNVVFLLPFGTNYMVDLMEEMAKNHEAAIKEFFGNRFREDMIMRISEDERQEEIRNWDRLTLGLENWDSLMSHNGWTDATKELPKIDTPVLCIINCDIDGKEVQYHGISQIDNKAKWCGINENEIVRWWRVLPIMPKTSNEQTTDISV